MKKILFLILAGILAAQLAEAALITFGVDEYIPDNDPIGIQNTQNLSGYTGLIASVQVELVIAATNSGAWTGDYYVTLQHDSGFAVLLNRPGVTSGDNLGYGDNGFDIMFADGGDDVHLYQTFSYILDGDGALTGFWEPDGRNVDPLLVLDTDPQTAMLSSFNGLDANGNWTLFVADNNFNGDGTLVSWGLDITTVIPEPGTAAMLAVGALLLMRMRRSFRPASAA